MPTIEFHDPEGRVSRVPAEPGQTLLEVAEEHDARVGSACGGVCACSSCHVWIRSGGRSLSAKDDAEEDRLDMAFDVRPVSRLGCQAHVGNEDLVVEITLESIRAWYDEHPERRHERTVR